MSEYPLTRKAELIQGLGLGMAIAELRARDRLLQIEKEHSCHVFRPGLVRDLWEALRGEEASVECCKLLGIACPPGSHLTTQLVAQLTEWAVQERNRKIVRDLGWGLTGLPAQEWHKLLQSKLSSITTPENRNGRAS